ncbi:MAG: lysophospholipid acyltransferase family protein [Actinomycetota bacterium]
MHELTYRLAIRAFRLLFVLLRLRISVRGPEHLPTSGPAIVACNHVGFLDFALVGLVADRRHRLIRFMAKQSTFDNRVSGPPMRAMRHIPVDRSCGAPAARQARDELRRGELVGIFPEATISRAWTLKPFKRGAATLAVHERVPIVPVAVWGGHRVLTVDGRWSLRRGKAITIQFGEPILPTNDVDIAESMPGDGRFVDHGGVAVREANVDAVSTRVAARDAQVAVVGDQLRDRMQDLLDQAQRDYPDLPRNDADRWWMPRHLGGSAPTPQEASELDAAALLP